MKALRIACEDLGLTPQQFGALTPAEFAMLVRHAENRKREAWDRAAWIVAHVVNLWSKRRVTPAMLLGRPMRGEIREMTQEERAAAWPKVAEKIERLRREGKLMPMED